jgi:hypothetical protein
MMRLLPNYSKEVTAACRIGVGFLIEYEWKLFIDQKSLDVEPDVKISSLRILGFSGRIQQSRACTMACELHSSPDAQSFGLGMQ